MIRPLLAVALAGLVLSLSGCQEGADGAKGTGGKGSGVQGVAKLEKLNIIDIKEGEGAAIEEGDLALMAYTGRLTDGTVFDSNDKPDGTPFSFAIGKGAVIKGWDEGIVGMKVGGERTLEVPADKGYGAQEAGGGKIPANSDLYFTVKLLDMVKKGEENYWDKKELKVGAGPVAEEGDQVTVDYLGKLVNGRRFDSTYERKKPETFKLGTGDVIIGLDTGIRGMKQGGKRWLRLPPNIAYGSYGMGHVPPDSVVIFEVELLRVEKG